jgi:hypothetical protein
MRLVLFDWALGGHHPTYIRRFAEALNSVMEISVAAPDSTLTELGDLQAEMIPLGRARPADVNERMRTRTRTVSAGRSNWRTPPTMRRPTTSFIFTPIP